MDNRPEFDLDPTHRPDYVAHGSAEHAALLGLVEGMVTGEDTKAAMEEALAYGAPRLEDAPVTRKKPVTAENYRRGEQIIDGWSRR